VPIAINNPELAFLIAFLAGFSERFTIKTIDRFMTVLTVGEDPKKTGAKALVRCHQKVDRPCVSC
jgi:hypothetical protein